MKHNSDRHDMQTTTPAARKALPTWCKRFLLCLISLLVALAAGEFAVRLLGLGPRVYAPRRFEPGGGVPFVPLDPRTRVLAYRPNSIFSSVYDPQGDTRGYLQPDGRVEYRINNLGLRGPDVVIPKPPDVYRILCLGDSFTFGEGVKGEDTYSARLPEFLRSSRNSAKIEVINGGVQAYGVREAVTLYAILGEKLQPDVVVYGFVLNDVTEFAETIRQNDAKNREAELSWPAQHLRMWEIVERSRLARRQQEEFFELTRRSFQSPYWQECQELLQGMARVAREDHFRFVVMVFPIFTGLEGEYPFKDLHQQISQACQAAGCEFIDLLEVYRGLRSDTLWVHPTDQHPNEMAHRLAAKRLADYLR